MVLPIFRPNSVKGTIPKEQIDVIQNQLVTAIARPAAITASDALPFLSSYIMDLSSNVLDPESETSSNSDKYPTNTGLRSSVELQDAALALLEHLTTNAPKSIPSALLIDAMLAYSGSRYNARIQTLGKSVLNASPYLSKEILAALQTATQSCFGPRVPPLDTLVSLYRAIRALDLILNAKIPSILEEFTGPNNVHGCLMLVQIYDHLLPSIATTLSQSSRPIAQTLIRGDAKWANTWLQIKIAILDVLQVAFLFVVPASVDAENMQRLAAFASTLTSAGSSPAQISGRKTLLVDSPLLADYERLFQLSETLRTGGWKDGGPTAAFASFAEQIQIDTAIFKLIAAPRVETEKTPIARSVALPQVEAKGKGKGKATPAEHDPVVEEGLNAVLAILPDHEPEFIRRCLKHPTYSGDGGVERLLSALLEGSVPIELSMPEEEHHEAQRAEFVPETSQEEEVEGILRGRANVLDALQMDMSSLRLGKKQDTADQLLNDSAWIKEMKAEILRRAQEGSDGEDKHESVDHKGKRKLVPFDEDEFDDDFGNVSVMGDGETSDGEDEEVEEKVPVETRLELAYISNPALFERDAATRRSAGRKALKSETGWSDEQIEGWKIMLDRNPKKDKILEKHEFRGNKAVFTAGVEARGGGSSGGPSRGYGAQGRGRGRGRGGGRGNGGGGEEADGKGRGEGGSGKGRGGTGNGGHVEGSNKARDRAWKEKNKSRARQGGHDRKIARGGGPE